MERSTRRNIRALAVLFRAGFAATRSEAEAPSGFLDAARALDGVELHLYAAAARRRAGELSGDDALVAGADEWMGDRAITYAVDLGRSKFEAIDALLKRLMVVHDARPIQRILFGSGYLPD